MVEIDNLIGGQYVSVELVKLAKDKRAVIISEGNIIKDKWDNDRLEIEVQIDTFTKSWTLNQETLRNFREQWGNNSKAWIGKIAMLSTSEKDGKRFVVGLPFN